MKQVKSTAISVFALALALMWLAPLVWLVGTAFSEPTFHMTFLPNSRFTFGNLSYVWNAIPFAILSFRAPTVSRSIRLPHSVDSDKVANSLSLGVNR